MKDSRLAVDVVDFFSGCGGMSWGFAHARTRHVAFRLRGAVDIDVHANATYKRMLGIEPVAIDVSMLAGDEDLLRHYADNWGLGDNPLVLIGCAPCQGFSSHRKKDSRTDSRNDLLEDFAKMVTVLKPEVVVMENVPEVFSIHHWAHYDAWKTTVQQAGYRVRAQIHNLATFGVPQERFRAIVIASRVWPAFGMPAPSFTAEEYRTVRDAIGHLPSLKPGDPPPAGDPMHITSKHRAETIELLSKIPKDGGSRRSLPEGEGPECLRKVDGFRDVYGRLSWDKASVAITARCRTPSCGRFTHPEQNRGLSVREAALLQGFPESFYFEGPFDDKYKQICNAVSPVFAEALAKHIDGIWLPPHGDGDEDELGDVQAPLLKSFSSRIASLKKSKAPAHADYTQETLIRGAR